MNKKYHIDHAFLDNPVSYNDTLLYQIGRLYCMPDTVIGKHAHIDWYEITVITDGKGTVISNDIPLSVSKGDIYFSIPGDFHDIRSSTSAPLKYDFFSFNTENKTLKAELRDIVESGQYRTQRVFRDEQVNVSVSKVIEEISSKREYHHEIISLLLEQILYYIIRNFHNDAPTVRKKSINSSDELCFRIMYYIDTNIYNIENLAVLSDKFNYSYSYLSDLFKKTTGNTINAYYQTRRLDIAKLLIAEKKLKLNQIAEKLNYSSLYSFSKAFKQKFGISPKYYNAGIYEGDVKK